MKDRFGLIDEYRTPDEWKERAKKIAHGKGIYASVKRTGAVKWVIAAAAAAAIGFEGYALLNKSVTDVDDGYTPVPQVSKEDDNSAYIISQKIGYYYPDATDNYRGELTGKYSNSDCELFLTNQNGCAYAKSEKMQESIGTDSDQTKLKANVFYSFEGSSDGYIIDGSKVIAMVRFTSLSGQSNDLYDDINRIEQEITPHVCIIDGDGNEIEPVDVKYNVEEGMVSYYARVEVTIPEEAAAEGFGDKTIDIHLYPSSAVDGKEIKNTNDEIYGGYHYDLKIRKNGLGVSSKNDAFDIMTNYYGFFASEMSEHFRYGGFTKEYAESSDFLLSPTDRISGDKVINYFERSKSYTDSIDITCQGYVTDGYALSMYFTRKGATKDLLRDFTQNYDLVAYYRPTGQEIAIDRKDFGVADVDNISNTFMISIRPDFKLDGGKVEIHFISKDEQYQGESSLHYVFTFDIPEGTSDESFSEMPLKLTEQLKSDGKDFRSNDIKVERSFMGLKFGSTDELDKAFETSEKAKENEPYRYNALMLAQGFEYPTKLNDDGSWADTVTEVTYWAILSPHDPNGTPLCRITDGDNTSYYVSSEITAGDKTLAIALPDEYNDIADIIGYGEFDEDTDE
ncbi:MAG: hypothetical protein IJ740_04510 [Ruminococcus sp.]|nr:hypothetical protein [Ruminococcus sp.]